MKSLASPIPKMIGHNFKKTSRMTLTLCIKFDDWLQLFQIYHWGPQNLNYLLVTWIGPNPFKGDLSSLCWDLTYSTYVQNLTTVASAIPEIGFGQPLDLNGSRDLTTHRSGMAWHMWSNTCYGQPIYQIRIPPTTPLWRYERRYKM